MTTTNKQDEPIRQLQALGFSEYEARAYVTLLEHGELSGYAWAQQSGIPRANIYAVARKLAERGAVQQSEGKTGSTWSPVPVQQLLSGIRAQYKRSLTLAEASLASLGQAGQPATVFNLRGNELLVRAHQLINAAENSLLIAIQPPEAAVLAPSLRQARERGVAITTLCLEACEQPCDGCQGDLHRYQLAPCDGSRWLVVTTDHNQVLMGQLAAQHAEGIVTAQYLVVELAEAYIRQSLALATLGSELAGRFDGLLSEQARRLLATLFPEGLTPSSPEH